MAQPSLGSGPYDSMDPLIAGLPEVIIAARQAPSGRRYRMLTPVYGSLLQSFSGTTWHLAQAAMDEGILDGAFTLNVSGGVNLRLQAAGALWKAGRSLQQQKSGGYKFVSSFHDVLWSQHIHRFRDTLVLNNTQIFGPTFLRLYERRGIVPCFYIDGTLTDYFYGYGQVEQQAIGADIVRQAIALERDSYHRAARIITMSEVAQRSLTNDYEVPAERIVVVLPGANLDARCVPPTSSHTGWHGPEFVVGFVGLFPLRKGLDKLADAVRILRSRGQPIRLRVIGRCPDEIAAIDGIDFLGTIDKATSAERFVSAIRTVDLGCQLSRAELLGIAVLEFLRVGVPVMATAVGGVPDVLREGGGFLLQVDVTAEAIAEELQALMQDSGRYNALRQAAAARSGWASWQRAAVEIDAALAPLG